MSALRNLRLADDTPLVCAAQTWCEHSDTRIAIEPPGSVHFAREVCRNCDRVLRWLPKPENVERRRLNGFRIAKLLMAGGLTTWERAFIESVVSLAKISPKQQICLDKIYTERLGGVAR